ncbi:hypothetical protein EGH24_04015 [Halonotius terrestris]|uniref:Uncharacterized protein n=1 Tax=Halonotius terrestris TaxID=2487750 RepID=A0A8J8P9Z5_9EURY|nr:hypothetical protein [Halonotius terrestris]TQQ82626.1 hypothetical protein EGH24_04015 [Halonotius terrestris]
MADTKQGRDKQAHDEAKRQRERDLKEARRRGDEDEPDHAADGPATCYRRNCSEPAAFVVLERYQEEGGHGAVEARVELCQSHTAEESPVNLDAVYDDYVFRVEPISDDE